MKQRAFLHLCLVSGVLHAVYSAVRVLVSYRALSLGGGAFAIGVITALFSLLPLVVAVQVGRAVDRNHAAAALRAGVGLTALGVLVIASSPSLVILSVGNVFLGFGQILAMVAAQGFVPILSESKDLDGRFAAWSLSVSVGQTVGLPIVGLISAANESGKGVATTPALLALLAVLVLAIPSAFVLREMRTGTSRSIGRALNLAR